MFSTPYFGTSPFGEEDQSSQTEKLTTQYGLQSGGNWYGGARVNETIGTDADGNTLTANVSNTGQDNPWLTSEQDYQSQQQAGMTQQFDQEGNLVNVQQERPGVLYDPNAARQGQAYRLQDGRVLPVNMLYGYDRFGIGASNRNVLNQMVGWNDQTPISGIRTPDQIAEDYWLRNYTTHGSGYTDFNSSPAVLQRIANDYLNQDYFRQQRGGSDFDIANTEAWQRWSPLAQEQSDRAMVGTQAMNNDMTGQSGRDLGQFALTAATLYFGGAAAGGSGGGGAAAAGAGAGGGAAASTAGLANFASNAANLYARSGGEGSEWAQIAARLGRMYAGDGTAISDGGISEGGAAMGDTGGWDEFGQDFDYGGGGEFDMGNAAYDPGQVDMGSGGWGGGYEPNDYGNYSPNTDPGYLGSGMSQPGYTGAGGTVSDMNGMNYLNLARQGYQTYQGTQQPSGRTPPAQGGYQMNWPGLLSGLYGMYGARQNQRQNQGMMNQVGQGGDPFGPQRGFYQNQLRQSYEDPQQMWNSPQWQALRSQMLEESTARDAAGGRLSDFGNRDRLVAREFMGNYLPRMQQNLQGPAGANANPGAGAALQAQLAGQMGQANQGRTNAGGYLLNQILRGQQPGPAGQAQNPNEPAANNDFFQQLMQWYQGLGGGVGSGSIGDNPYNEFHDYGNGYGAG